MYLAPRFTQEPEYFHVGLSMHVWPNCMIESVG